MSFIVTDKKKITLLNKAIATIAYGTEEFQMQIYSNKLWFFAIYEDDTFTVDINQSFFAKFEPVDKVAEGKE